MECVNERQRPKQAPRKSARFAASAISPSRFESRMKSFRIGGAAKLILWGGDGHLHDVKRRDQNFGSRNLCREAIGDLEGTNGRFLFTG
jgi:hypothetical protein